jgi:uncharacterized membrane protein
MDNLNWRTLIVIYIVISGIWGALAKFASDRINNPYTMSFVAVTGAWLTITVLSVPRLTFQSTVGVSVAALCGFLGGLSVILFYSALRQSLASVIIPLSSLYIIVTVFLCYLFLGESLNLKQLTGIILGLVSIYLLAS